MLSASAPSHLPWDLGTFGSQTSQSRKLPLCAQNMCRPGMCLPGGGPGCCFWWQLLRGRAAGSRQLPRSPLFLASAFTGVSLCPIRQLTGLRRELGRSGSAGPPTSLCTGRRWSECHRGWCKPAQQVATAGLSPMKRPPFPSVLPREGSCPPAEEQVGVIPEAEWSHLRA